MNYEYVLLGCIIAFLWQISTNLARVCDQLQKSISRSESTEEKLAQIYDQLNLIEIEMSKSANHLERINEATDDYQRLANYAQRDTFLNDD
ncbi:hypothetical protein ACL58G_07770 [Massilia sp. GER05]|uniref:hypothetical protein n=1 Tax=Massilia sp. GER05 TaxID=3394605 RepID=UPI003F84C9AC